MGHSGAAAVWRYRHKNKARLESYVTEKAFQMLRSNELYPQGRAAGERHCRCVEAGRRRDGQHSCQHGRRHRPQPPPEARASTPKHQHTRC